MKVLFDTNVLLDVLLEREPHVGVDVGVAAKLMALVDNERIEGLICATAVTTLFYIGTKDLGPRTERDHLRTLLSFFKVAAVDGAILQRALEDGSFSDFKDAVVHEAAQAAGAAAIVTRTGDFA